MTRVASAGLTQTILGVLGAVPMAIAVVFVWPLSNKYGKKNVTLVGMIVGVIGGVIAWIGGSNIVPVAIGVALKCLGSAPACYMILAMISDVLDHVEAKSGFRCDGLTMSIYSAIMVASTPITTGIFNGLIGATGYNADLSAQAASTVTVIQASYVWVETIAYAVCGVLLVFFLVEKFLAKDKDLIMERQKAEGPVRRLVGLKMVERGIPRHGYPIAAPDGTEIGRVTSGTMSPCLKQGVALGYVQTAYAKPGTQIAVVIREKCVKAEVVKLPFV